MTLPPLAAEKIFSIGNFPVTNTYINSSIALVLFIVFAFFLNQGIKKYYKGNSAPKGIVNFFEGALEFLLSYVDQVTRDRKKSLRYLPIVGALFLFILVSNYMGLLPGTGSIGVWHLIHGEKELVPILRPANTDLNLTLGMAVFAVIISHFMGIITIGFFKYANKFIKFVDIYQAVKSLKPVNMLVAFIEFFVGLIEVFSEVAKMVSLSLRLFGNIFAGEVLLTVLASLVAIGIPLPFMALELLVGFIQATVFAMLTLVYLVIATTPVYSHEELEHKKIDAHAVEDQA
jgi:F-type H+-transporting ATPase subunit a